MSQNSDTVVPPSSHAIPCEPVFKHRPVAKHLSLMLAAGLALAVTVPASAEQNAKPPFPVLKFDGHSRDGEAINRLGNRLPEVAAWYRMSPKRLGEILQKDRNAWLDQNGRLLFVDDFPAPPPQPAGSVAAAPAAVAAPLDLTATFLLHSKPGSQRVMYLDFNGHTTTGSAWNAGTIVAPPFDLDGVPASISDVEKERIQYIWQRVADDYAPFDVDVTTEEPTVDALRRTSSTDQLYGSRVVITSKSIGVCTSCGGIAYVGVFDWYSSTTPDYYQPAWVLYDALGAGNEKYVAEAISHEAGHHLGLSHDGTATVGYYAGHGSGATGWAPIMGVGYYQALTQWSKGEYPGANNTEDDFLVIQSYGAALKSDDFGNSIANSASLAGTVNGGVVTVNQTGLIETRTDLDYFGFSSGSGPVQITLTPGVRSPNLDASLELLDAAGNVIASSNPVDTLDASISTTLSAGAYYLKVDGVGKGDLITGYSDYASVGQYTLSGSYTASNAIAPVAVASASPLSGYAPLAVGFSSNGSSDADGVIVAYAWNFGDGSTSTTANPLYTYNKVGTFTPTLTVTDSQGLKDTKSLSITVTQNPLVTTLHVDKIGLTYKLAAKNYQCTASVTVKNYAGGLASGAKVSGKWTGVTTATQSANTNTSGVATFTSTKTTARGTCTFSVSGVTLSGWSYDPAQNLLTTNSLTY